MKGQHPLLTAAAVAVYIFLLGPLVIVIGAAVSDTTFLAFPPQGFTWRWFANVFATTAFRETFLVSLQIAVLGTAIALLVGIPAAYAMSRHRVQLPKAVANFFVLPVLIPEIVFGFSLLGSVTVALGVPVFPALLMGHTILVLPYAIRVTAASLAQFDFAIEEAAISLGSPPLRTFLTVVLPNIRSGMIAAFILAFITSLNNVPISLFLTGPGVSTLPIQMLTYVENFFDPTVAALSVLLMILTIGVMIVVERTLGLSHFVR
jgi:putative spermidine/putrescine transport system permease protein